MAVHINWFGVLPEWGLPLTNVQAAAAMCDGLVKFRAALHAGTIPVESMRGNQLDMHQFLRVFGMTRVPKEGQDELVQDGDSQHIVIMRESAMVAVPIYTAAGAPLSLQQLQAQLVQALALAERPLLEQRDHEPLSVLTSLPRDEWAAQRALLLTDPTNAGSLRYASLTSLRLVESAL
jgi:carnitine O-acetyltransferase